jgi:hypothetical protein
LQFAKDGSTGLWSVPDAMGRLPPELLSLLLTIKSAPSCQQHRQRPAA